MICCRYRVKYHSGLNENRRKDAASKLRRFLSKVGDGAGEVVVNLLSAYLARLLGV